MRATGEHLRGGIEAFGVIDLAELFARLVNGDVSLRARGFFGEVGRAAFAELTRFVPADLGTDPDAAARALTELRLDLLDRFLEGIVPAGTAQAVLEVIGGDARAPELATAEQRA